MSLCLFSVYINNLPLTRSRKFIYPDDICLATQDRTFTALEDILSEDLDKVTVFLSKWHLQPSVPKTLCCVFHLHNATASQGISVQLNGQHVRHEPNLVYQEVTLDQTLSYHAHLKKSAPKVSTRNNLLRLLAGSSWGASATTLRTSALALCYSTAEYCAPVWTRLPYTKLTDVELNESMHTVSGALHPTPLPWLPHCSPSHPANGNNKSTSQ